VREQKKHQRPRGWDELQQKNLRRFAALRVSSRVSRAIW